MRVGSERPEDALRGSAEATPVLLYSPLVSAGLLVMSKVEPIWLYLNRLVLGAAVTARPAVTLPK